MKFNLSEFNLGDSIEYRSDFGRFRGWRKGVITYVNVPCDGKELFISGNGKIARFYDPRNAAGPFYEIDSIAIVREDNMRKSSNLPADQWFQNWLKGKLPIRDDER
jgi:hypothetical protein